MTYYNYSTLIDYKTILSVTMHWCLLWLPREQNSVLCFVTNLPNTIQTVK